MSLTIICPRCGVNNVFQVDQLYGTSTKFRLHSLCESCADKEAETVPVEPGIDFNGEKVSEKDAWKAFVRIFDKANAEPSPPEVTPEMIEAGHSEGLSVVGLDLSAPVLAAVYREMRRLEVPRWPLVTGPMIDAGMREALKLGTVVGDLAAKVVYRAMRAKEPR